MLTSVRWDELTDNQMCTQSHSLFHLPFSYVHSSSIYRIKPISRRGFLFTSPDRADSALILYILSTFSPQREKTMFMHIFITVLHSWCLGQ